MKSGDAVALDAMHEKIQKYTAYPFASGMREGRDVIVLAQPGDSLERAFELARRRLDGGESVRIIGPGVTLRRTWPAWARSAPCLALTEWGAFSPASLSDATRTVEQELRGWVNAAFDGDFAGKAPEEVFYTAACQRLFQRALLAYPIARAIAAAFPTAEVERVRPDALTALLLRQFQVGGGEFAERDASSCQRRVRWRLGVLGVGAAALAVGVARVGRDYVAAAPTFRAIRAHRVAAPSEAPHTWVGVVTDWHRMNYHLLDAFAIPEARDAGALGILFVGTVAPFRRGEGGGGDLWPGLGELREKLPCCAIEQAVMPEEPAVFARAVARGLVRSAGVLWNLAKSPEVRLKSMRLAPRIRDVVPWATMDVLRATLGDEAGKRLMVRVPMSKRTVVFNGGNNVAWTAVDLSLQAAGATTIDHPHGAGSDNWVGMYGSVSSLRLVWTYADARSAAGPDVRTLVTGMPVRFRHVARARPARRVLFTTGYVHRDAEGCFGFPGAENPFPHRIYQREILDVARLLEARGHSDLEFRWRPHPSDVESEVQADSAALRHIDVSRGRPLAEDAAWADIIVSSLSTVVIESLFASVPMFVQVFAESDGLPTTDYLSPERVFLHAEDGARLVSTWLANYGKKPADGLGPEAHSRLALFGSTGRPEPMQTYFGCNATKSPSTAWTGDRAPQVPHRTVT